MKGPTRSGGRHDDADREASDGDRLLAPPGEPRAKDEDEARVARLTAAITRMLSHDYVSEDREGDGGRSNGAPEDDRGGGDRLFKFSCGLSSHADTFLDGGMGSALVAEVCSRLKDECAGVGRDRIKRVLLACLRGLRYPVLPFGDRQYTVSIKPRGLRPPGAALTNATALRGLSESFPAEIVSRIRTLAGGEFWWSRARAATLPPAIEGAHSFTVMVTTASTRRLFGRVLPFPCTRLEFGPEDASLTAEWSADGQLLWLRGATCEHFVQLVRFERRSSSQSPRRRAHGRWFPAARMISVRGHGEVLI